MERRMCDVAGCGREGMLRVTVTKQETREAQTTRVNREMLYDEGIAIPPIMSPLGRLDLCDAHVAELSLAEVHQILDSQLRTAGQGQAQALPHGLYADYRPERLTFTANVGGAVRTEDNLTGVGF